jgi:hypothetical protein
MTLYVLAFVIGLAAALLTSWRADKRAAAEADRLRREPLPDFEKL